MHNLYNSTEEAGGPWGAGSRLRLLVLADLPPAGQPDTPTGALSGQVLGGARCIVRV